MKNTLFTYCFLIGLLIYCNLHSQENANYHFKKIMVDNGLSENTVYCISQDSKGFIWFGTKDGLDRYDGSSFRVFRKSHTRSNSLGNNFVKSIIEGDNNQLYIGTDCGLYIMNTNNETFNLLTAKTASGVNISTAVNALYLDKNKNLWIGTMSQGVFIYNIVSQQLQQVNVNKYSLINSATWTIYCDKSGIIWIGNRLGLLRYNPDTKQLDAIENLFNRSANSSNFEILSILEDTNGNLWLGTWNNGIELYNRRNGEVKSFLSNSSKNQYISHIRVLQQYNSNVLLVGSDDGLYMFNTNTLSAKRVDVPQLVYSMSDQSIYSIYKDQEGGFWFGTYFGGVNYLNESLLPIETYHSDRLGGMLSGKAVSQFCEDQSGNMWIATEDGGINYLNVTTKKITQPIKTSYHNIHALLMDGDDLWIGTFSRGVDVYNIKTKRLVNFRANSNNPNTINDDCVFSLYKTRQGDIYIGTPMGLCRYNNDKTFTRIKEAAGHIYDIKEDDAGNLWLANYNGGIIQYNAKKRRWLTNEELVSKSDLIINSKLTEIYIDNHKRIIFCSEGNGIFIYNPNTGKFQNISEKDGLPNNVVYGVLDDAFGNLWISTNKGIVCMNLSHPKKHKLFTKDDGLQSNQFNYKSSFKANDGKFYFGGINGFSCFYPHDLNLLKNNNIPRVEITGLELLKSSDDLEQQIIEQLNEKKKIVLPYNKSSFKISYISLSYISQSKNQYAYKLEGIDNDWLYAGNNKNVTYVNLPPGNYTFKVKASNNSGIWNEEGTQVKIVILPPFWWSFPAKILYLILCLIFIYKAFNYYSDRTKQKQTKVLEAFKAEQETRSYKSKIDFFTNIAHEIRTPLSLIKAPLEEVISSGEGGDETKQNLSIIQKNSNRLSALINQLLDFRKMDSTEFILHPEKINLYDYLNELCERFKKTAQSQGKEFILKLPSNKNIIIVSDADALTKIIGNLLTNAIKFTKSEIIISLIVDNNMFKVTVEDNGKGIPDEFKELIFDPFYQVAGDTEKQGTGLGLSLAKKMAQAVNGTITVENAKTSGSIFTFEFYGLEMEEIQTTDISNEDPLPKSEAITDLVNRNKYSILVVDDNPDITSFIRNCLQSEYQIETASNASSAIRLLETTGFDLIITDIMMPDIDGISFTKRIKGDVNYSHIPIILLSAKTENAIKVEGLRSGAEVFVEKPFSVSVLKAQLVSLLENRKTMLDAFNRSPMASYSSLVTNKKDELFITKLNEEIEKHLSDENFSVESLTDVLKLSRSNLQRKLKGICDMTPGEYLRNYRLRKACTLLLEKNLRPGEVAYTLGFSSPSYFTKAFIKYYNMTPKEFLKKYN